MASEEDVLDDAERGALMGEAEGEAGASAAEVAASAAELQHARMQIQAAEAVQELTEDDGFRARLDALEAFAASAASAGSRAAEAFREVRVAELSEQGRAIVEEARAAGGELSRAFAEAAGDTRSALLARMRALQALSLSAERTLALLRKREQAMAAGLSRAEAELEAARAAVAEAEAAAEAAVGEEQEAAARAALGEARSALGAAEAAAEGERSSMQANLAARAEARERESAASEARSARINRLRRARAAQAERDEAAARAGAAALESQLAALEGAALAEQEEQLRRRRLELERRQAQRREAESLALARREARLVAELSRARRRAAANIFLRRAPLGRHVVFVVDRSGSMTWGGVWVHVTRQLEQALAVLHPAGTFRLVAFNEAVRCSSPLPVPATRANAARAMAWLERLEVLGGHSPREDFGPPLLEALRDAGPATRVEQVFLVSDAEGNNTEEPARRASARGTAIHCLAMLPDGRPVPASMASLSAATGGTAVAIRATS